jgi:hypothetical protein
MSFLGFGRPQPTSAEKIAAVEAEMKLLTEMANRYVYRCETTTDSFFCCRITSLQISWDMMC